MANAGIANLVGGLVTISADSDIQATFEVNVTGQESDAGAGLALPENVIAGVDRLLNNRCSASARSQRSSFVQSRISSLETAPDATLGVGVSDILVSQSEC